MSLYLSLLYPDSSLRERLFFCIYLLGSELGVKPVFGECLLSKQHELQPCLGRISTSIILWTAHRSLGVKRPRPYRQLPKAHPVPETAETSGTSPHPTLTPLQQSRNASPFEATSYICLQGLHFSSSPEAPPASELPPDVPRPSVRMSEGRGPPASTPQPVLRRKLDASALGQCCQLTPTTWEQQRRRHAQGAGMRRNWSKSQLCWLWGPGPVTQALSIVPI
nr:uncharacterized protein LOC120361036 [Saimiri boliviensis boliviensis]